MSTDLAARSPGAIPFFMTLISDAFYGIKYPSEKGYTSYVLIGCLMVCWHLVTTISCHLPSIQMSSLLEIEIHLGHVTLKIDTI